MPGVFIIPEYKNGVEKLMYKKILLATDGSDNAGRAAIEAAGLAGALSSQIILVYISANPPSQSDMAKANFDVHKLLEDEAKKTVSGTIDLFESENIDYTLRVAIGEPAKEITAIAGKENAELVVMGSRGLGALKGAVIGSVSQKVAHMVKCPVLIVK